MIFDKRLRALISAGLFCLAAALGGGARAAEVYPGCAQPGPTGKVWWVDPVNGKTPADGGNGSKTAPWNSLQGVLYFKFPAGYPRPLLSSVPYFHVVDGKRAYVADQLGSPPIQPGDTIKLMSGNYGDIIIGDYNQQIVNSSFVTVEAAPGQTPVFSTLYIRSTDKWVFKGVKVQSTFGTSNNTHVRGLVTISDQGASLPTTDIILENLQISSADNTDGWTKEEWIGQGRDGFHEWGTPGDGTNGEPNTTCVSITKSRIWSVRWGVHLMGNNSLFSHNEIDHFGDDGLDYGANNISITHNYFHDNLDLGDGNHPDVAQGQNGPLLKGVPYNHFSNILIDSNLAIRQTDPKLPFPFYLQGIDAFDMEWTNVTVTNNVIVTSGCWGIYFSSVHNSKIINNTVVADGLLPMPGNCKPLVAIGDKTHQGPSSSDVIVRNNIANGFSIYNPDPNVTMDHNICLGLGGRCQIVTYENGKPNWGIIKPGMYGDHNIIDGRGAGRMFVNFEPAKFVYVRPVQPGTGPGNSAEELPVSFDPAKFRYDLRLRPEAAAIGAGNTEGAPSVDIAGARRGSRIDVGAYQSSLASAGK
ncbi:MAG: right-handed parallel beta-helix repeat-containing protein [Hyphomicrobiales bacterium]|nr:right-handed parallel beta-helix repeat-containing protein [Hyphomicrobiales bacterium]